MRKWAEDARCLDHALNMTRPGGGGSTYHSPAENPGPRGNKRWRLRCLRLRLASGARLALSSNERGGEWRRLLSWNIISIWNGTG